MAEGMMGRGPARRGRLSDEQRAQIRQVRMDQGRGAARAMRRDMRREAGLPVRQRQRQDGMGDFAPQPAPPTQQSPMVMGQPTGDMMAFRPMPTERPLPPMPAGSPFASALAQAVGSNPFPQGPTQGVAQGVGAALGNLQHQPLMFDQMSPEARARQEAAMQAMRDRYTQGTGQPMPGMNPNFGPMPSLQMPMQQPMQQEPGYLGSIRRMMNTGRMDANHPAAQAVRGYDRQNMMNMFGQKQAQNATNPPMNTQGYIPYNRQLGIETGL